MPTPRRPRTPRILDSYTPLTPNATIEILRAVSRALTSSGLYNPVLVRALSRAAADVKQLAYMKGKRFGERPDAAVPIPSVLTPEAQEKLRHWLLPDKPTS